MMDERGHGGERIPVYAIWPVEVGPMLSLGMLTANARVWHDGALLDRFEIRRPETAQAFLDDLSTRSGPAVLLCSNYVWSLRHNLETATVAVAAAPELVVIHGGPSTPKYEGDAEEFLARHGHAAHVLARGEGEETLCELLSTLADCDFDLAADAMGAVAGITYRDPSSGAVVRTADRDRLADLNVLPSPYLSGEFDEIPPDAWYRTMSIETNRGCPYGCTFCDWGSATMSRLRSFDLERVAAEFEWAARQGIRTITITDANFGIRSRDVEIAEVIADVHRRTGWPRGVSWTGAKNTTKHLIRIMEVLLDAGVSVDTCLSLQTTDPETLEVLARTNISTDHYVRLAADYRRRGFPIQGELMLGLPSQSFRTYKADLQFMLDHEIVARTWPAQMLPNAPMNAPEYRAEHGIEVGEENLIVATNTFDADERRRMWRFRTVDAVCERMGVLRHVMRYLQWDHGIAATDVMERLLDLSDEDPVRYPRLSWLFGYFDLFQVAPAGWSGVYEEVVSVLATDFGIDPFDTGLATTIAVQRALMPAPGRTFPYEVLLPHDYVGYYLSATEGLYTTGESGAPDGPLRDRPPAPLVVSGDPLALCTVGLHPEGDPRDQVMQGDFYLGSDVANELDSPLVRLLPAVGNRGIHIRERIAAAVAAHAELPDGIDDLDGDRSAEHPAPGGGQPVVIGRRAN